MAKTGLGSASGGSVPGTAGEESLQAESSAPKTESKPKVEAKKTDEDGSVTGASVARAMRNALKGGVNAESAVELKRLMNTLHRVHGSVSAALSGAVRALPANPTQENGKAVSAALDTDFPS